VTAPLYCAPSDLYAFGLPRGSIPNPGRLLASVSTTANTLTLDEHGLADDDEFRLRVEAGGTLPGGLVAGTTYFAKVIDESQFQARATAGGAAIDITSAGDPERVLLIVPLPVLSWIRWASREVEELAPAHVVPFVKVDDADVREDEAGYDAATGKYPGAVVICAAELAATKGLGFGGASSRTLSKVRDDAEKRLARWAAGIPIRNAPRQTPANLATSATVPYRDRRGWSRYGGTE
jgi:hypothetical protein